MAITSPSCCDGKYVATPPRIAYNTLKYVSYVRYVLEKKPTLRCSQASPLTKKNIHCTHSRYRCVGHQGGARVLIAVHATHVITPKNGKGVRGQKPPKSTHREVCPYSWHQSEVITAAHRRLAAFRSHSLCVAKSVWCKKHVGLRRHIACRTKKQVAWLGLES